MIIGPRPARASAGSRGRPPGPAGRRGCRRGSRACGSTRSAAPSPRGRGRSRSSIASGVSSVRLSSAARLSIRSRPTWSASWNSKTTSRSRPISPQHLLERLGLRHRAREAVEHEALARVGGGEPLADQRDHQVVGDEAARVVDRLHLAAELRPRRRSRRAACRRSRRAGCRTRRRSASPGFPCRLPAGRAAGCRTARYFRKPS